ncbi:MAG: ADP-forming succinate--CoA ligase subunit beta [Deltaproteobacteria bacterium]|nr:ADP-forming succinate--CoA ligase subunit beta [Deltaproteobacteria bacterium]
MFRKFGIPVPDGNVAKSGKEAFEATERLNGPPWVVKAQVHAGGRGKGGGVRVVSSPAEVREAAQAILGQPLVTKQTGPEGKRVSQLLIEEGVEIDREFYLAMVVDRSTARPVMIFSQSGGMDIEEVADKTPELVCREAVPPDVGWSPYQARNLAYRLDPLPASGSMKELMSVMDRLYQLFMSLDCSLAEINPLVITKEGKILAVDAKITVDDNALFRQKEMHALDDPMEKDRFEFEAERYNLNYIRLDGNIGAMVNGAGLAMATMDVIKMAGAEPANFLDVGGGADEEMIGKGFEIILGDEKVKAILINIFGGILRCDVLARGVVAAAKKTEVKIPLIVRLEGTNVEEGRKILEESDLEFLVAGDMVAAADLVTHQVS